MRPSTISPSHCSAPSTGMDHDKRKKYTNESIAQWYNRRVDNDEDLNTRLAMATNSGEARGVHHHTGLVYVDDVVPANDDEALKWLYEREERLCDLAWNFAKTHSYITPPKTVFDAGCGEGGTLMRLNQLSQMQGHGPLNCTGATLSEAQQKTASKHFPQARWLQADYLVDDRIPTNHFDMVVSIESTTYIGVQNLDLFMERAFGWLKLGGMLIIIDGSMSNTIPHHHPAVQAFDKHYECTVARTSDYRASAKRAGLHAVGEIDLVPATVNYWKVRAERPVLRNSEDGMIETVIAKAMDKGFADFRLYAWTKRPEKSEDVIRAKL